MALPAADGFCLFQTGIGDCAIAWEGAWIVAVHLPQATAESLRARMASRTGLQECEPPAFVGGWIVRIQALLRGEHDDLADLPLALDRLPTFHRSVYAVTRAIPPGRTMTYGEVARAIGDPGASRSVGQALGANPFAPVIPCHRVLAAGGRSGGFSATGGTDTKLRMLEIERARFGSERGLFD